mmetsp:Transcript_111493/g.193240  ORF Transcript_111493/g.193240 Transcript_111493/m.193240 type:complete len:284 (+) Transcript_111493:1748-2599(+)
MALLRLSLVLCATSCFLCPAVLPIRRCTLSEGIFQQTPQGAHVAALFPLAERQRELRGGAPEMATVFTPLLFATSPIVPLSEELLCNTQKSPGTLIPEMHFVLVLHPQGLQLCVGLLELKAVRNYDLLQLLNLVIFLLQLSVAVHQMLCRLVLDVLLKLSNALLSVCSLALGLLILLHADISAPRADLSKCRFGTAVNSINLVLDAMLAQALIQTHKLLARLAFYLLLLALHSIKLTLAFPSDLSDLAAPFCLALSVLLRLLSDVYIQLLNALVNVKGVLATL